MEDDFIHRLPKESNPSNVRLQLFLKDCFQKKNIEPPKGCLNPFII